ncbi:hypothetical protein AAG906_027902 [Vitis piasezkii]
MCPIRDWFSSYQEVNGGKVLLGNNMSCNVVGIGTVAINMFDGKTRTLKEVRHDVLEYVHSDLWGPARVSSHGGNRAPSSAIDFKTPEELWSRKPSNYEHLRIFGCTAYVHQSEGKLEPRSIKCIFLGYLEGVKGYRLWNKESLGVKIIISRDVVFNENEMLSMRTNTAGTKKDSENRSLTLDKDHFEFEVELSSQYGHDQRNDLSHGGLEIEDTKVTCSNVEAKRNIKPPNRFGFVDLIAYALLTAMEYEESEPLSYQEAINNNESMKWLTTMSEEFESLQKNQTWVLVERKPNQKVGYLEKVLKRFSMENSKPVSIPLAGHFRLSMTQCPQTEVERKEMNFVSYANAIGSLMFMANPGREHWNGVTWLLRYVRGSLGYVDSDYVGDLDKRKSTIGYIFTLFGGPISWKSQL